jgi:hypothetical protein
LPDLGRLQSQQWLWYQQNLSYSLLSEIRVRYNADKQPDLAAFTRLAHRRSAAIISVDGIIGFLDAMLSM